MNPQIGDTIPIEQLNPVTPAVSSSGPQIGDNIPLSQITPAPNSNPLANAWNLWSQHVTNTVNGMGDTIKNAWDNAVQTYKNVAASPTPSAETTLTAPLHYAGDAFSVLMTPFTGIAQLLGVDKVMNTAINSGVINPNTISDAAPKVLNNMNDYFDAHPDVKQAVLQDIPNILNGVSTFVGAPKVTNALDTSAIDTASIPSELPPVERTPEETAQLQAVAADWQKPTQQNIIGFNNARAVLEKDPEIPQYLAEHGLNPYEHIQDGKYVTQESAQNLREDMGQLSRDGLRPALQNADYSVPPMPVSELPTPNISKVDFAVTPGDSESIQTNINNEVGALERKYPNGMNLENQLDEKINYDKNGGYSPIKDPAVNNKAIANRAIANSLRESLIKNSPSELHVQDFQDELSKGYRAADYLDTLQGKKAPVSIGQKIARYTSKIVGAKIAGALGGGDLVSEFVGYHIGGALEHLVENLTNPMRDQFLRNLKISNPQAFIKLSEYIGQQAAERATRLSLPAPSSLGTEKNPIITPSPTTYEAPAQVINRINSLPGKTVFDMMNKAQQKEIIQKFLNEPYINPEKLPVIKGGKTIKPKPSKLPIIR